MYLCVLWCDMIYNCQEWSYATYGKNWKEGLFYTHMFGLPYFILFLDNIQKHIHICNESRPLELFHGFSIPILWFYMFMNVVTQYPYFVRILSWDIYLFIVNYLQFHFNLLLSDICV